MVTPPLSVACIYTEISQFFSRIFIIRTKTNPPFICIKKSCRVVSGSRDATLRVWDVETGECLHVLVGHVAAVRCVQYDGRLVVSGAYDYTVKVWDPEREECLHTLQGHTNRVYSLQVMCNFYFYRTFYLNIFLFWIQFDGIHVVSGSLDTSIRVWDAETGACKHTLMGHQSLTSGMELRNNILVSGNADSTVKVWDIISGKCLQTLSGTLLFYQIVSFRFSIFYFMLCRSQQAPIGCYVSSV
jgi:WD40 repeat protein